VLIPVEPFVWLGVCIIFFILGLWTSAGVEKDHGKDPRVVVIDEFVGQWVALLFLPRSVYVYLAAFVLFRILDIIKPFPAADMEDYEGGPGIMLDDLIAGIYTNMAIQIYIILTS
jgi:phosphatidylglycerophosphatase A